MKRAARKPRGKTPLVFAFFVLLVVAVINLTGWALWSFSGELLSDLLDSHLTAIASLVSHQLDGELLTKLRPGDENSPRYKQLRADLAAHRARFQLADIYVFDAENRVIASAILEGPIGQENAALTLDTEEILDAWMGGTTISPIIERGANVLKTGYSPVHDKGGHIVAILGVETDVRFFETMMLLRNGLFFAGAAALVMVGGLALLFRKLLGELLLSEEQSQETQRLALVGRLSAQICHEIRNPLSTIGASSEFVVKRLEKLHVDDPTVRELVGYMSSEIDRLNDILTRFLDVARRPVLERKTVQMEALLVPLVALAKPELEKSGVTFSLQSEAGPCLVDADASSLRQVLLNAILNARDAMIDAEKKELTLTVERAGRDRIALRLDDTGPGVPPEVMKDVFEPFVTGKPSGTGLGLFIAKRIVDEHGGEIRLENRPEGGTRFTVELPISRA